jgi:NNP family nitrate/nitrite transporter-like MFS transporter
VQLIGLLVIGVAGLGHPRVLPLIFTAALLVSAALAWTLMDDLPGTGTAGTVYQAALRDRHCWTISLLYVGTFGSFIGYSFAFGLVLQHDFGRTPLQAAGLTFIGPLLGSLARPGGGYLADRFGAARVTLAAFTGLALGTAVTIGAAGAHSLPLFTAAFVILIAVSGLGNGSTYAMIPVPYAAAAARAISAGGEAAGERLAARRQAGAVIAIAGTIGGLGGVAINLAFRQSYQSAHTARPALIGFLAFYAACAAVTAVAARRQAEQVRAAATRVTAQAAA